MEPMEIAKQLQVQFPGEVIEIYDYQGQVAVVANRERIIDILRWLRDTPSIDMDHLMALCGVDNLSRPGADNLERFEVVYNLYSTTKRHMLRIRAQVPEGNPCIDSATSLWSGADWLERETYDLVGITFTGHPNMKRILLPDDWQGHPLVKNYPLKGEQEWSGMVDLIERVEQLREFDFYENNPSPVGKDTDQCQTRND